MGANARVETEKEELLKIFKEQTCDCILTATLWFTGWSCSIDTVHSKYCNTELHTSRKCHCSVGVTSGDVGVDTVIRGVDDSDHILHCTVTHTPANQ